MLIVLEGVDGSGKTTLAQALQQEWLNSGNDPATFTLKHFGPPLDPDLHPLAEYVLPFDQPDLNARILSHRCLYVCDRLSLGDQIYGPKYRGYSRFTDEALTHCEMHLSALGALKVVCSPPLNIVQERIERSGDDYINFDDIPRIWLHYRAHAARYNWLIPDWQLDPRVTAKSLIARSRNYTILASHTAQATASTYTGALNPDLILTGDEIGAVTALGGYALTRPFTPVTGSGCSEWLIQAITEAGIVNQVGLVNAYQPGVDLQELNRLRPAVSWAALGNRASTALTAAKIPHEKLWHPQFAKRFRHADLSGYAASIRRVAVSTEENQE